MRMIHVDDNANRAHSNHMTNTTTATDANGHPTETTTVDFGLFDEKGRAVGGKLTITYAPPREFIAAGALGWANAAMPARGETWCAWARPTRAGESFGPAFNRTSHASIEEARAWGMAQLAAQAKRAAKKYGDRALVKSA